MGGYGITEDCPGFLGHKWMDSQLEATYEGPEAVQRRQLSVTMTDEVFLAQFRQWTREMRLHRQRPARHRSLRPGQRHGDVAVDARPSAKSTDADGGKLYQSSRQGVTFPLADALCWLLASRCQILDVLELEKKGPREPHGRRGLAGTAGIPDRSVPRAVGPCRGRSGTHLRRAGFRLQPPSGLGHGRLRSCYQAEDLDAMESLIPGIASLARGYSDVIETTARNPPKAGPCVALRRARAVHAAAGSHGWLPHRFATG